MKKVLTYLGLILAACLVLVACANKPAEKKKATPTPTELAKADATVLIDTMLGKSSNGFSKLYGENYETWTETKVFEKQVADTIEEKGYTPEEKYTFKYIEGYDAKTPTQVLSKFLKVRRNMIGKIQDYKLKDVKVKGNEATVTFTSRSVSAYGAAAAVRTLLMSLYDNDIDKLKQWNQADNNDVEKGKAKDLTTKFLYGENFNGDLTQFKDIDKEMAYTPLTGADNLEKTFKLTKDDGGNWTISIEDYKELAEALVDHDESGSRAVYAERIHKNLSDYQPEDSSYSSSKSSSKDK
ncbi:peptidase [Streptococcus salivarius]